MTIANSYTERSGRKSGVEKADCLSQIIYFWKLHYFLLHLRIKFFTRSKLNPPQICEQWLASRYYSRKLPRHCLLFQPGRFLLQLHCNDGISRVRGGSM